MRENFPERRSINGGLGALHRLASFVQKEREFSLTEGREPCRARQIAGRPSERPEHGGDIKRLSDADRDSLASFQPSDPILGSGGALCGIGGARLQSPLFLLSPLRKSPGPSAVLAFMSCIERQKRPPTKAACPSVVGIGTRS